MKNALTWVVIYCGSIYLSTLAQDRVLWAVLLSPALLAAVRFFDFVGPHIERFTSRFLDNLLTRWK